MPMGPASCSHYGQPDSYEKPASRILVQHHSSHLWLPVTSNQKHSGSDNRGTTQPSSLAVTDILILHESIWSSLKPSKLVASTTTCVNKIHHLTKYSVKYFVLSVLNLPIISFIGQTQVLVLQLGGGTSPDRILWAFSLIQKAPYVVTFPQRELAPTPWSFWFRHADHFPALQ